MTGHHITRIQQCAEEWGLKTKSYSLGGPNPIDSNTLD